ncbi:hypothetical protein GCM10027444_27010 [Actinopolyspora lacussalsi]
MPVAQFLAQREDARRVLVDHLLEFAEFGPGVFLESHPVLGARYDVEDPKLIEDLQLDCEDSS